jgi:hypothetical protein
MFVKGKVDFRHIEIDTFYINCIKHSKYADVYKYKYLHMSKYDIKYVCQRKT